MRSDCFDLASKSVNKALSLSYTELTSDLTSPPYLIHTAQPY
jgi:hypothetical protein